MEDAGACETLTFDLDGIDVAEFAEWILQFDDVVDREFIANDIAQLEVNVSMGLQISSLAHQCRLQEKGIHDKIRDAPYVMADLLRLGQWRFALSARPESCTAANVPVPPRMVVDDENDLYEVLLCCFEKQYWRPAPSAELLLADIDSDGSEGWAEERDSHVGERAHPAKPPQCRLQARTPATPGNAAALLEVSEDDDEDDAEPPFERGSAGPARVETGHDAASGHAEEIRREPEPSGQERLGKETAAEKVCHTFSTASLHVPRVAGILSFASMLPSSYTRPLLLQDSSSPDYEVAKLLETGARIKFLLGQPPLATAGLVGPVMDGNMICIGFDDGDVKQFAMPELQEKYEAKLLQPMDPKGGGLIKGESAPPVSAFSTFCCGRMAQQAIVGLLHGRNGELMHTMPYYAAHTLCPAALRPSAKGAPTRSSSRKKVPSCPPYYQPHNPCCACVRL